MLPRRYRGAAVACCHCWPARHEGTVRAPRRCRQGDEPDDIGEVSRHEGYGLVPIWCRDGVATAACVLRVQRRWGLLVRHVLCGSAPWLLKERAPICSSEWAECLHVRYIANLCQDCTNSPAPADIDMNEPSDEILTIDEVAAYLKAAVSVHRCAVARLSGVKQRSPGCAGRGSGRSVRGAARGQMTIGRALRRLSCGS